jgi:hypothetical protein
MTFNFLKRGTNRQNIDTIASKTSSEKIVSYKNQGILLDQYEKNPTKNFEILSNTIAGIIKNSQPSFSVGVYGEWGTGKTTLMKAIEKNLNDPKIPPNEMPIFPVWFNAWRFERSKNPITFSIIKEISLKTKNHSKFDEISSTFENCLKIYEDEINLNHPVSTREKPSKDNGNFEERIQGNTVPIPRDSLYHEGFFRIKDSMDNIREKFGKEYRIVVFIDDLDRCSVDKIIEMIEVVKLFLEIEGFVFVIGISHDIVTKIISNVHQSTGVKGEDYLKKIIQIPIKIPSWSSESFLELLKEKISPKLTDEYSDFLLENPVIVSQVVNSNPRQLKRFINNLMIAFETFVRKGTPIQLSEIFLVKVLKSEWPDFYREIVKNKEFREIIYWTIGKPKETRRYFNYLEHPEEEELTEQKQKRYAILIELFGSKNGILKNRQIKTMIDFDNNSWVFFENIKEVLLGIKDWKLMDKVTGIIEDLDYDINLKPQEQKFL